MEEKYERLYFDTLDGTDSFMEVGWNRYAIEDDLIKITVEGKETIIRKDDLETYMFLLSKNPQDYVKSTKEKIGVKYLPVPQEEYRRYKEYKLKKQNYGI